jgi:hypothetical protein
MYEEHSIVLLRSSANFFQQHYTLHTASFSYILNMNTAIFLPSC